MHEGSGAMQYGGYTLEGLSCQSLVVQREAAALEAKAGCELLDGLFPAAGQDRGHAALDGLSSDELPRIPVGPIEDPSGVGHRD